MGLLFILFRLAFMSEDQSGVVTLKVRVTPEFRQKIVETAKANNRSMNQEIVSRLEHTFTEDEAITIFVLCYPFLWLPLSLFLVF